MAVGGRDKLDARRQRLDNVNAAGSLRSTVAGDQSIGQVLSDGGQVGRGAHR